MFRTFGYFLEKTYIDKKPFCLIFSLAVKNVNQSNICDALDDLVPFLQFKKRDKHSWRKDTFSKAAGLG